MELASTLPMGDLAPAEADGYPRERLLEKYQQVFRSGAIFYPTPYTFSRQLGQGRQGRVMLVNRQGARGCVTQHALKIFDPSIYPSSAAYWTDMGRLAHQITRLQHVRSPNLVSREIYEETEGIGYIQMEAIDGIDLEYFLGGSHLARARKRCTDAEWEAFNDVIFRTTRHRVTFQPGIAIYIMRRVLRGLEILHENGFVHSDVKPANLMLDRLGYVKIIDFGRAVQVDERVHYLFGTPLYMAPEIHRRGPSSVASDLYSVGLLGLQMLSEAPLVADRAAADETSLYAWKQALPRNIESILPEHVVRNELFFQMLRRLIDPDPDRRFQTAEEAESAYEGLALVHKQLVQTNQDAEYGRELENYLNKLADLRTNTILLT